MTIRARAKLKGLLSRARRLTASYGKKTELADFVGASLAQVSQWLAENRAPNGEVTLLMLEWVAAEEAKNKSAGGSVRRTTAGRTRTTSPKHEKANTGPPRR